MSPPARALVIVPTYEERDTLANLVSELFARAPFVHLLVVDDASPDGTGAFAESLAQADDRIHVLHRPGKLGLGTAYVEGFAFALARGYPVVVEMDADLSHDPRHLPGMLDAIDAGADVVVGSRSVPGGGVVGWGWGRHVLSKGGSLYARSVLGVRISDLTTGYKAYRAAALRAIDPASLRSNGYAFQIETTYRALRRGLEVVELPIVFVDRRAGSSKMSRAIFLEAIWAVWRMRRSP